jgi:RNA polymerase sigma factor (sigma-70 family)
MGKQGVIVAPPTLGSSEQPEHQVEEEEWKALLKRELATLPPNERRAIYLRFIQELPIKQIALETGRSQSSVHNDIRQGLKALRLKLVDLHI